MPRLSDKHIAAIRAAAEDNDQTYGFGDVILLCDELQERRKNGENVPTVLLGDRLLERLMEGSKVNPGTSESLIEMLKNGRIKDVWEVNDEVTNTTLTDELIKRIRDNEAFGDAQVLGVFNAWKKQGYFQTVTLVNSVALRALLYALSCPEQPHLIREIQATRGLPTAGTEPRNPIDQLIVDEQQGKQDAAD